MLKLGTLKREICEHIGGKFSYLNVYGASIIPQENAISLLAQYEFSWRRTPEKWGDYVMRKLEEEYPATEFVLLRTKELEKENFWDRRTFEAVVQIKQ